jgi:prepilin-type N-terminal cleavage/methylation domain-containing protein
MRGFTLLEVVVVLTLFGLVLGASAVALGSLRPPPRSAALKAYEQARTEAIMTGAPRSVDAVLFLPDGRAVGPGIDPLTGTPNAK